MEEKKRKVLVQGPEETPDSGADIRSGCAANTAEDGGKKQRKRGAEGSSGRRKTRLLPVWIFLILCVVCAGGYYYYYNRPEQKLARAMEAADTLLEEGRYEEAAGKYAEAAEIDTGFVAAREGRLRALTGQADLLAGQEGISERARGCELYRQILELSETQTGESEYIRLLNEETQKKLEQVRAGIAADYTSVETEMVTDDRSGTVKGADGTEKSYSWYYDLVRVSDPEYPYAEEINTVLEQERDAFFERTKDFSGTVASSGAQEGDFRDYTGLAGIYTGEGLLCIRSAEVRIQGSSRRNEYTGRTFRLSDACELTLADLVKKTESGLRRLLERRLREWFALEGYRNISRSALEDYVQDTPPEAFKFCFRDDGKLCLVIDQTIPFFTFGSEILEIPLEE